MAGQGRGDGLFSASSSGLQYALAAHWRSLGLLSALPSLPVADAVQAIAVVSGSCSPVTAGQIGWARDNGFAVQRLDIAQVLDTSNHDAEIQRLVAAAVAALQAGRSPLVYSAEGPDDATVTGFDAVASALDIAALSIAAGLAPGAPLCRAGSDNTQRDGLQVVLKGGQMGVVDFFGAVRQGRLSKVAAVFSTDAC